ncbi:MAG TPA: hypothetical protein VME18_11520 [Acidobacteriaceae bacterium]|nr:hypothetical protein [Acidobacteriaceae bacterium]
MAAMDGKRELLRHAVATVAYRAARALEDAPEGFGEYAGCGRTPAQILAHMGDLFDWALSMAKGEVRWRNSAPLPWNDEKVRFFASLEVFDQALASPNPIHTTEEVLLQAPVADALTHVGQLAMMRRLAGSPAWSENFSAARITAGRAGAAQPAAVRRFR